ncbi:MAG: HPr family phosphocarrier protein [Clostridium sp.]|nr:Phosphocarrier protein HPr [uncultured Clostridium sp.]
METFQYTITDGIGIHARPAGELAKLAKKFRSQITIKTETKQADAEKLMAVMALGIRHGQTVTVEVCGADEEEAAEAVQKFFEAKL